MLNSKNEEDLKSNVLNMKLGDYGRYYIETKPGEYIFFNKLVKQGSHVTPYHFSEDFDKYRN